MIMATESIHKGHRERLKQRFLEEGLDNFTDIQVLELLLLQAKGRHISKHENKSSQNGGNSKCEHGQHERAGD